MSDSVSLDSKLNSNLFAVRKESLLSNENCLPSEAAQAPLQTEEHRQAIRSKLILTRERISRGSSGKQEKRVLLLKQAVAGKGKERRRRSPLSSNSVTLSKTRF